MNNDLDIESKLGAANELGYVLKYLVVNLSYDPGMKSLEGQRPMQCLSNIVRYLIQACFDDVANGGGINLVVSYHPKLRTTSVSVLP